jgi:hypothetical protein
VPIEPLVVPSATVVLVDDAGVLEDAGAVAAGELELELELLLLPHAATNNATPTTAAVPAVRKRASVRRAMISLMLVVSIGTRQSGGSSRKTTAAAQSFPRVDVIELRKAIIAIERIGC